MRTSPGALLVVDDNEMNRDMLSRRLPRQGYEVVTAVDGRHALELVERAGLRARAARHRDAGHERPGGPHDPAAATLRRSSCRSSW